MPIRSSAQSHYITVFDAIALHKACPYRGRGGRLRGTTWVRDRWHRQDADAAAPTRHGVGGACAGFGSSWGVTAGGSVGEEFLTLSV